MTERLVVDFRKRKFAQVTKSVLNDEVVLDKPIQKLVYTMLCMYADNTTKDSYPSIKTLAKKCYCSENTVRGALKKLQEVGVIDAETRYRSDGSQTSNIYQLVDPPSTFDDI
ncbi:helix-turn-helix domain-containing protein [Peribacillus huizhouensis]|uniref:ArsR family transcriptional regulator n=1 Tax=Peribacillus huizhouensis TaxID=1501239 RepID=A0ABR6CRC8_9BACI|nr:helix-turn-helix domain-containing protein [Peribacillus huizhouensis]MBA9027588.1 putative ArsR family transcriptional regulator [Peribacillus huizhouensis]